MTLKLSFAFLLVILSFSCLADFNQKQIVDRIKNHAPEFGELNWTLRSDGSTNDGASENGYMSFGIAKDYAYLSQIITPGIGIKLMNKISKAGDMCVLFYSLATNTENKSEKDRLGNFVSEMLNEQLPHFMEKEQSYKVLRIENLKLKSRIRFQQNSMMTMGCSVSTRGSKLW